MKQIAIVLLSITTFLLSGCNLLDNNDNDPGSGTPATKKLSKIFINTEGTMNFYYDANGRLSRYTTTDLAGTLYSENIITRNPSGRIVGAVLVYYPDNFRINTVWSLNSSGQYVSSITTSDDGSANCSNTYSYSGGKLIEIIQTGPSNVSTRTNLFYDNSGNVIKELQYSLNSGSWVLSSTSIRSFDTKENPFPFRDFEAGFNYKLNGPNNLVSDNSPNDAETVNYTYNSDDLPASATRTTSGSGGSSVENWQFIYQ